jgi:peptide-methionine (R)-S-oxide reductase
MQRRSFLGLTAALAGLAAAGRPLAAAGGFPLTLTDAEWRARLTAGQYAVLRDHDTEPAFSSPLDRETRKGTYACAGCDQALFASDTKYDSGTGWPSFWQPLPRAVGTRPDWGILGKRTEVHCANCGGHLGHVFNDGPEPTGKRYCMNGLAMVFRPA